MKVTPMIQQYLDAKSRHPEAILFFRMGDFYEMFFEDAVTVARDIGLTLTARNKGEEDEIPMAGVPHHAATSYINDLIARGHTVAICEQLEDPSASKGIVKRDVVRVITPGVVVDTQSLDARTPNYVAALFTSKELSGLAYLDVSTGEFRATELLRTEDARPEVLRFEPRELLVQEDSPLALADSTQDLRGTFVRPRAEERFDEKKLLKELSSAERLLAPDPAREVLHAEAADINALLAPIDDFGFADPAAVRSAAVGLLRYVVDTQRVIPKHVGQVTCYRTRDFLVIDEATRANLELTETLMGAKRAGSLLSIIDQTVTAMGSRTLRNWLQYPLVQTSAIEERLEAVEELSREPALRQDLRILLDEVYDLERLAGRISSGTANARDLRSLCKTLQTIPAIKSLLVGRKSTLLEELSTQMEGFEELTDSIEAAIVDDPPASITDGGMFRRGWDDDLDEILSLAGDGRDWLLAYERQEKAKTGITSLKVRFNKVFGYYIEVTRANLDAVPDDYIRKQTLANAERYFTEELKEMEERVLGAEERRVALERKLFEALRMDVATNLLELLATARKLAVIDVLAGFAELAMRRDYARPTIHEDTLLEIAEGRHPVVETTLKDERFVPNSVILSEDRRLQIITGPNMAGKSTIIRQVALIVLLAQMGSFVPAKSARVGVADRIFSRVGASDNLARGQSTFMVEMTETAHILQHATERSLVILDEIGRGTATFDGLSIAWAVAEHLHDTIAARTMFATHYHELTELSRTRDAVINLSVAVKEFNDNIIFLRKLVDGQANRSYGIQVGRLAGLPQAVVERAQIILENLEAGQFDDMGLPVPARMPGVAPQPTARFDPSQLSLFQAAPRDPQEEEVLQRLRTLKVEEWTPVQALNLLDELSRILSKSD